MNKGLNTWLIIGLSVVLLVIVVVVIICFVVGKYGIANTNTNILESVKKKFNKAPVDLQKPVIVVQGRITPVTFHVLDHYCRHYPNVILSTWEQDVDLSQFKLVAAVFSKLPNNPGRGNRILQRITTYRGLLKAKKLGFTKALKVRTDHLFTRTDMLDVFENMYQKYPLYKEDIIDLKLPLKGRKIVGSAGTTLATGWGFYHTSDLFMYGNIDDLIQHWDCNNPHFDKSKAIQDDIRGSAEWLSPEPEYNQLWMKWIGIDRTKPFEEILAKYFIIAPVEDLSYNIVKHARSKEEVYQTKTDWNTIYDPHSVKADMWLKMLKDYGRANN